MEVNITDNTKQAIDAKDQAVEQVLEMIGGLLERYAKQSCPVDTGLLRNSITYCLDGQKPHVQQYAGNAKTDKSGGYDGQMAEEPGGRAVYVGTNVEYARIVEFNEKARHVSGKAHFIRDSLKGHIGEYQNLIARVLKKI